LDDPLAHANNRRRKRRKKRKRRGKNICLNVANKKYNLMNKMPEKELFINPGHHYLYYRLSPLFYFRLHELPPLSHFISHVTPLSTVPTWYLRTCIGEKEINPVYKANYTT